MRELSDSWIIAGTLYFGRSRSGDQLQRYLDTTQGMHTCVARQPPGGILYEVGHMVFADFEFIDGSPTEPRVATSSHGWPIIRLFTAGISNFGVRFSPAELTYRGCIYDSAEIHNWGRVYALGENSTSVLDGRLNPAAVWRAFYKMLLESYDIDN